MSNKLTLDYFDAPWSETGFEEGPERCAFCGQESRQVRPLGELANPLPAGDPRFAAGNFGCFDCLRAGAFEIGHDVEDGRLAPDRIVPRSELRPSVVDNEALEHRRRREANEAMLARISGSARRELSRTPPFNAWQGAVWLIHCDDFMRFIGVWAHDDFVDHSPDGDAAAFFYAISDGVVEYEEQWGPDASEYADCSFYAFACRHCGAYRGYVDSP